MLLLLVYSLVYILSDILNNLINLFLNSIVVIHISHSIFTLKNVKL